MKRNAVVAVLVVLLVSACGEDTAGSPVSSESITTTESPSAAATTTEPLDEPFAVSVNDVIAQVNLQLPYLIDDESPTALPATISPDGTFGGQATPEIEIRIIPEGNAFEPVSAIVVRTSGEPGSVTTPARLLSGIGASLHSLSADAVAAFGRDALPRLSVLNESRTTVSVGAFYDLTIEVVDLSRLTYIFTPVGVPPATDLAGTTG